MRVKKRVVRLGRYLRGKKLTQGWCGTGEKRERVTDEFSFWIMKMVRRWSHFVRKKNTGKEHTCGKIRVRSGHGG